MSQIYGVHQDDDSDNEALGTITLIMGNRENKHPSLIDVYFNGIRSEMTIDTGAAASILHHTDEPKRDRIFKIKGRKTYHLPHRYDVNWREMDANIAPTLNNENDEVFWSFDDEVEDMGDTSSDDESEDDMNKSLINEDESRLNQVKPPNNSQKKWILFLRR